MSTDDEALADLGHSIRTTVVCMSDSPAGVTRIVFECPVPFCDLHGTVVATNHDAARRMADHVVTEHFRDTEAAS
jgi:hypothetical protein